MKTKIVPITKIVFDKKVYPRTMVDWVTVARYKGSMLSGAKFPPIVVAKFRNRLIVLDGAHRIEAMRQLKEKHVSAEILTGLSEKEIFIEAVKRNIGHGRQFSGQERAQIVLTLEKWEMSQDIISEIIRIPVDKLEPFMAKRMTRITGTQEIVPLKQPLQNLAGIDVEDLTEQKQLSNRSQVQILNSLIILLKNKWIDTSSEVIKEKLQKVYNLLRPFIKA